MRSAMGGKIRAIQGDITKLTVDAIVNAANTSLLGGSGVDGAIHRAGGGEILDECMDIRARQGGCRVGDAVVTGAGRLPAAHVIHTVGPVWRGGEQDEARLLTRCYSESLQLAAEKGARSVAFPAISCGVYGYPIDEATGIAIETVRAWLTTHELPVEVIFCCFTDEVMEAYERLLEER
ncbi:MAG: O-acetyl-ADP-ribose deacetylase (regulator of RNase III) [Myxococcota bacterium]|jgi:O-acetyl-ADP-ribose deacetylase (regulator of RNase III)